MSSRRYPDRGQLHAHHDLIVDPLLCCLANMRALTDNDIISIDECICLHRAPHLRRAQAPGDRLQRAIAPSR